MQPDIGLVPAFEADGRGLFESGAIVHRIAVESEALMPADRQGSAETVTWMFAALNTVEPPLLRKLAHRGGEDSDPSVARSGWSASAYALCSPGRVAVQLRERG